VCNGHMIADIGRRFLIGGMDNGIVLHIGVMANPDIMHITPEDRPIPNAAAVADLYFTDNSGILGKKTIFADSWGFPRKWSDQRHIKSCLFPCKYTKTLKDSIRHYNIPNNGYFCQVYYQKVFQ
jgi:hypothetical protein